MKDLVRLLRGNLSQKELADLVGTTQDVISRYEAGRMPKPEMLEKIAAAVGKRIRWSVEDIEDEDDF